VSATAATVHWTDAALNETGYLVFRSIDGVGETLVAQLPPTRRRWRSRASVPLTNYVWTVVALNEGALSNPLTGAQPTLAPGVIATAGSGNWSSTVPGRPVAGRRPADALGRRADLRRPRRRARHERLVLRAHGGRGRLGSLTFEARRRGR
jgi:hypothetical protein